ncbi:hypothetical protein SEA_CHEWYVIII_9 [Rhodococcus phage ChewyVIII]|uniref:Uncharacterized protein n=1 Tax=Rhodococcus phage ChewyVIII TaxID=1887657 RepID=A0A1C9EI48_9CAUD|nr:hypothetical protein QEH30_gp09 [Rhodococcus phage ChewyVIII]AON97432.1 hypothetical protein SEA_CHEWYVIII_9 [Rhodococcus phage ChewyVIII]
MRFVELVDNEGKTHYVNPDQICSIQPIFAVSGPKDRDPEGSRMRINGYTRALLLDLHPIDLIDTIHQQEATGGVRKYKVQASPATNPGGPNYVAGLGVPREALDRYMNSTEPFARRTR